MTAKVSPVPPALAGKGNLVRERPQKALESQIYGIWYNYAGMQFHGVDMLVNDVEKRSQSRFAGDHHGASGESDGRVTGVTAKKASRTARRIRGWPTGGLGGDTGSSNLLWASKWGVGLTAVQHVPFRSAVGKNRRKGQKWQCVRCRDSSSWMQ